jgi:hypothetical protein
MYTNNFQIHHHARTGAFRICSLNFFVCSCGGVFITSEAGAHIALHNTAHKLGFLCSVLQNEVTFTRTRVNNLHNLHEWTPENCYVT